ncbi:fumarylacetoacetate hydrolase family protein [Paenalcaligenes sp. Me52]|uniref:fumarylacetoacetate hydrolase family protein n=1 Tax=Paenalcaligenes sp. Me52 TaxID=3392038 RepID=UPI003D28B1AB
MHIVCFEYQEQQFWGVYQKNTQKIIPLHTVWPTHAEGLAAGIERLEAAEKNCMQYAIAAHEVRWLAPVTSSAKVICVGLNYGKHVLEAGKDLPTHPSLFIRFPDSLVGHQQPIVLPSVSDQLDYEGELAVVIGKSGRHISVENAMSHVGGYTCMAENSVRDFQKHAAQVTPGKNFKHSGALGPWIVTADSVPEINALVLSTYVNAQCVQHDGCDQLIFSVPGLIAYISSFTDLRAGDVIATGTPEGVGMKRKPPLYLREGDTLTIEISEIGTLRVPVVKE